MARKKLTCLVLIFAAFMLSIPDVSEARGNLRRKRCNRIGNKWTRKQCFRRDLKPWQARKCGRLNNLGERLRCDQGSTGQGYNFGGLASPLPGIHTQFVTDASSVGNGNLTPTPEFARKNNWVQFTGNNLCAANYITVGLILCPEQDLGPGFANFETPDSFQPGDDTCIYRAYCVSAPGQVNNDAFTDTCDTFMQGAIDPNCDWSDCFVGTSPACNPGYPSCVESHSCNPGCDAISNQPYPNVHWSEPHIPVQSLSFWIQNLNGVAASRDPHDYIFGLYQATYCTGLPIVGPSGNLIDFDTDLQEGLFIADTPAADNKYNNFNHRASASSGYVSMRGQFDPSQFEPPSTAGDWKQKIGVKIVACGLPGIQPLDEFNPETCTKDGYCIAKAYDAFDGNGNQISCIDRKYCLPLSGDNRWITDSGQPMDYANNVVYPADVACTMVCNSDPLACPNNPCDCNAVSPTGDQFCSAFYPAKSLFAGIFYNPGLACENADLTGTGGFPGIYKFPEDGTCLKVSLWNQRCPSDGSLPGGDPLCVVTIFGGDLYNNEGSEHDCNPSGSEFVKCYSAEVADVSNC